MAELWKWIFKKCPNNTANSYLWRIGITTAEELSHKWHTHFTYEVWIKQVQIIEGNKVLSQQQPLSKKRIVSWERYDLRTPKVKLPTYKYNLRNLSKESSCFGRTREKILITIVLLYNTPVWIPLDIFLVITLLSIFGSFGIHANEPVQPWFVCHVSLSSSSSSLSLLVSSVYSCPSESINHRNFIFCKYMYYVPTICTWNIGSIWCIFLKWQPFLQIS